MNEEETRYAIALTYMTGLSFATALILYRELGGAKAIYDHRHDIRDVVPDCSPRLAEVLKNWSAPLEQADAELQFINKYNIQALPLADDSYPARLRECPDAPIIIYYKGTADLNQKHVINIVGTRHCTTYGQDLVRRFITQLKELCPQVLIVSGLAYGIDICAHRQALASDLETVGVLAHGLEKIYPTQHRDTAAQMIRQGGLLTEYVSYSHMDKSNFVRRNRIVAGMTDATILVESAAHGGGLITAEIAQGYGRNVFAFPGPVGAKYSEGCNNLIRDNGAGLISSAEDFIKAMGWQSDALLQQAKSEGIERTFFPDLTDEEQAIVAVLDQEGDLQQNILSVKTNLPIGKLTAILFQLEMKGVVRPLAGGNYHLLK
ncbi:MAG: DNA-processing protein DprA [Prevotella sp.]|jgi:DNA processing protein|nr:DNA-processing protein DprA [Prevotella sp.]